jgi:hypothetical protein
VISVATLLMEGGAGMYISPLQPNKKPPGLRREVNLEGLNRSENDRN